MTVSGGPPEPPMFLCAGVSPLPGRGHGAMLGVAMAVCLLGTWSSRLHQPTYSLGELINIQASVSTDPLPPLRVFVDECVASPSAAAWPKYKVIADNG